jgi:hypothetical protein
MIPQPSRFGMKQTLLALALLTAYASASALPVFTLNPAAAGLAGTSFTADNIIVSDFGSVKSTGATSFSESGYLSVQNFQQGQGSAFVPTGLNSTYGLYIQFSGTGTQSAANPLTQQTSGTFNTLNYTLFGYNGGPATFGFDAANNATINIGGATPIALATGSLIAGSVGTMPASDGNGGGSFVPSANASLTFHAGSSGFFASPTPFYNIALTSFTNTVSQVTPFDGGFRISQGGGSINFSTSVSPIPEPETYALMLAGLGAVGWISRRRRKI